MDDFIEKAKDKAIIIGTDAETNIARLATKPFINKNVEIKDPTVKERISYSILGGLMALAATGIIGKTIGKKFWGLKSLKDMPAGVWAGGATSGLSTGYFAPDVINTMTQEAKGELSPAESRKIIRDFGRRDLSKEAGLGNFIGGSLSTIGSTLWKGIRTRSGIEAGKKIPLGRKVWGYTVKGGLGAGALYGGYKGYKRLSGPKSGTNYTTFLRNQVLAGNVSPDELSQPDLRSVRTLGMR